MARMLQRHRDQREEERGADRRHRERPGQREADQHQERELHRSGMAEVLRPPLADARQVLDPHQAERQDERFDAIGIDERRRERGEAEQRPGARRCETRSGWGLRQRLERERPDQHEAEDEAAMHVRPQGHQRGERERRRAAAIAGGEEAGAPGGCNRQRQHMRAREQARRQEPETEPDGRDERRAAKLARRAQADDQRGAGRGGAGHEHNAAPTAEAEGKRQQHFATAIRAQPTARPASNG